MEDCRKVVPVLDSCDTTRSSGSATATCTSNSSASSQIMVRLPTDKSATKAPPKNWWQEIVDDFDTTKGGDLKILRAIGRTAIVNAAVAATALTGGAAAGLVGFSTGGAITAKRLGDGIEQQDSKEVVKSLAVFGSATSASVIGQVVTGALMVGLAGAALPVAAAVAFGVGCGSGIAAGALSEWAVDSTFKRGSKFLSAMGDHFLYLVSPPKAKYVLQVQDHIVPVSKTHEVLYIDRSI